MSGFVMRMLDEYAFARDSEAVCHDVGTECTNMMLVAPIRTVNLVFAAVRFVCQIAQTRPFGLFVLRVVTVAKRNIEAFTIETRCRDSRQRLAGPRSDENLVVMYKTDR